MKWFYSKTGKIFLYIVCTVFTFIFLVSSLACAILGNEGLFASDPKEFTNSMNRMAGDDYATWILANKDSGFTSGKLEGMNCYYGVIAGKKVEGLDLNKESTYLYRNFKDVPVPDDAYIDFYGIDNTTEFTLNEKLFDLLNPNYINTFYGSVYTSASIQGIGYDLIGQQAYVYGGGHFYAIKDYSYEYKPSDSPEGTPNTNTIYSKIWENNKSDLEAGRDYVNYNYSATEETSEDETTYTIEDSDETTVGESEVTTDYLPEEVVIENGNSGADTNLLYIDGKGYMPLSSSVTGYVLELGCNDGATGKLCLDNVSDLSGIHDKLVKINRTASLENISSFGYYQDNPDLTYYTVVCFPNETKLSASTYTYDFYAQAKHFISKAPIWKFTLPIVTLISFVTAFGCWVMFLMAAGHRKGVEGIYEGPIEKIPADLAFVLMLFAEGILLIAIMAIGSELGRNAIGLALMIGVIGGCLAMFIGFLWSSNIAVNFKLHHVWNNSFLCKVLGIFKKWLGVFSSETRFIRSTVKWTYRIWAVFVIITLLEWFGIMATQSEDVLILWFLEKIAFGVILYIFLRSYARIKNAATSLANGDTTAKVDLKGMPLFLEEHGRAMNDIQSGITAALEERTKSERMKTELITNVSHDIKTPLTSIINYVDLLEKEDIKNEQANEYLNVLDRQSKRLKKLIEDLIEASKASTGNIKFQMEKINAQVLLNQSIGEFSDRLESNKIELVTEFPESDLYLTADNRYLWRVFDNLMSNIVKYSQPDTRCYINLNEADDKVVFTFRNTSKESLNISPEELMERFVRGDRSRFTDGNGLGLSIARSLTESMGGKMSISIDGDLFKATLEFPKL